MKLPLGIRFSGVACGIKPSKTLDLSLITTDRDAVAAGVYTQNLVRAASIDWNRAITPSDSFRGLVINSGNANACTGSQGIQDNEIMASEVAKLIGVEKAQVCVLSTGVIGHQLPMDLVTAGIADAAEKIGAEEADFQLAAKAILTTDKGPKTISRSITHQDLTYQLSGMAKGAGMIGPNMATMLAVMMTDAKLAPADAQRLLSQAAHQSFNRISVEGHTSTNDALILICSGASEVQLESEQELIEFGQHLTQACIELAKQIPSDGEGASHLVTLNVSGAESEDAADQVARTIAASALVKTAFTGNDPNWGRIVSAAGYSGIPISVDDTDLSINGHSVFKSGQPDDFDESTVSDSMKANFEVVVDLKIGTGPGSATHWTSDLTVDYVQFNSEYTT
jgi:glutamate N-acetyltransferase/amino-acid N-acetyltransferase